MAAAGLTAKDGDDVAAFVEEGRLCGVESDILISAHVTGGFEKGFAVDEDRHVLVVEEMKRERVARFGFGHVEGRPQPDRRRIPAGADGDAGRWAGAEAGSAALPSRIVEIAGGPIVGRFLEGISPAPTRREGCRRAG